MPEQNSELDRSVAEAIGLRPLSRNHSARAWVSTDEVPGWYQGEIKTTSPPLWEFAPSWDMNAAMWAAEKAGLFGALDMLIRGGNEWQYVDKTNQVHRGSTPAEAISRAILTLTEPR